MSTEVSEEVVVEKPEDPSMVAIRAQIKLGQAVRAYLDASEKFESASQDFSESCQAVRAGVKPNTTIVVRLEYGRHYGKHYLLKSDDKGDFEVEAVEVI